MFGGNLLSGVYDAPPMTFANPPLPAVSGQIYDGFFIQSLKEVATYGGMNGQFAFVPQLNSAWVDNGTGTATTNLAGFVAFEREIMRAIFGLYKQDASAWYSFLDSGLIASSTYPTTGAAVTTTDNVVMAAKESEGYDVYINPIGAHTVITPVVSPAVLTGTLSGGLNLILDATDEKGYELSPPNIAQCSKQFVVGKTEASFYVRLNIGVGIAGTDIEALGIGFRQKKLTSGIATYAVGQTAYEAASVATAAIGVPDDTGVAPVFNIITGPGAAGVITNTSAAVTPAVSSVHDLVVTVDIGGVAHLHHL